MQISLEKISFSYLPETPVLQDISLTINPGERVALLGRNGCGKTTLARHLNGLLQPSHGHVRIGDWDTRTKPVAEMAHRVGLLFQNPDDQLFKQNLWDEVAFGARNLSYPAARVEELVGQALNWLMLADLRDVNPYDLGYSQRKLVALASVIAMDTPILVLDEPTAGLDGAEIELFVETLAKLSDAGKTLITISHDMDFVAEQFSRVICMDAGKILFDGVAEKAFGDPILLRTCGIGMPQVSRLSRHFQQSDLALTPEAFFR
jgi:energy-coupling factor transport system ATP-binding protein